MKISFLVSVIAIFSTVTTQAGNIPMPKPFKPQIISESFGGPTPSPTRPDNDRKNVTYKTLSSDGEYASSFYSVEDIAKFDSVKLNISDDQGNTYSFIQVKQLDESYRVFLSQGMYQNLINQGLKLDSKNISILSEREYFLLSRQVQLNTSAQISSSDYMGGEAGRCAAGTIGSAIGGAIAGGAVAGPAGAVAGAVGGALYGSAGNCK